MNGPNGLQSGFQYQESHNADSNKGDLANGTEGAGTNAPPPSPDELDASRSQEITAKAVSGILIMLLKWFKISRTFQDATETWAQ